MKEKLNKINKLQLSEKQRTAVLVLLLLVAIGFIYWTKNSYDTNFVDGL